MLLDESKTQEQRSPAPNSRDSGTSCKSTECFCVAGCTSTGLSGAYYFRYTLSGPGFRLFGFLSFPFSDCSPDHDKWHKNVCLVGNLLRLQTYSCYPVRHEIRYLARVILHFNTGIYQEFVMDHFSSRCQPSSCLCDPRLLNTSPAHTLARLHSHLRLTATNGESSFTAIMKSYKM